MALQTVAVIGLGTMGHGIAQAFAAAGHPTRCYDESPAARESLHRRIETNLRQRIQAGMDTPGSVRESLGRIAVFNTEREAVETARFVTEAVREDLDVKRELFARVESVVSGETILASNTSSFPVTDVARDLGKPGRAVVTHWFNPPHIVPLVEVVPGERTTEATVQTAVNIMRRIGKVPVRLKKELPGFLVNRIQVAMQREILDLLDRGVAEPEDIDRAVRASVGFRLAATGPLSVRDFAGLDVSALVYQILFPKSGPTPNSHVIFGSWSTKGTTAQKPAADSTSTRRNPSMRKETGGTGSSLPFSDCYMKVKKPMNCEGHRLAFLDAAAKKAGRRDLRVPPDSCRRIPEQCLSDLNPRSGRYGSNAPSPGTSPGLQP